MTPEQFRQTWTAYEDNLSPLDHNSLVGLNLKSSTIEFLTLVGLPFDAAPFLSFVQNNADRYNTIDKLTKHYSFLELEHDKYVVIGSCGDGDVIAIDTDNNDQIVWLDHEDNFSSRFFNSSINSLAECLVIQRNFIQTILKENGEDALINSNFTDEQFETLKQKLAVADDRAITEDGFWKADLEMELAMRQYYKK
jgi:hypothetical protein